MPLRPATTREEETSGKWLGKAARAACSHWRGKGLMG